MKIFAIDPGPKESAWVNYQEGRVVAAGKINNEDLLEWLMCSAEIRRDEMNVVIEMIQSFGMAVGAEVFETCVWIGRFMQSCKPKKVSLVYRKQVKQTLCGVDRAKDANIRQALLDRFGPGKDKAIGLKNTPGPLYGLAGDMWSALAVAVTFEELSTVMGKAVKEIQRNGK